MDVSSNIFSYFVGGLALISTITSVLRYCRVYFPSAQMKILDELLTETKNIYDKANLEGLLPHEVAISAKKSLELHEAQCDVLREITYRAFTSGEKLLALFHGQTAKIMQLAREVGKLRSFLMTTSQKEKARRDEARSQLVTEPGLSSAAEILPNSQDTNHLCVYQPCACFENTNTSSHPEPTSITVSSDELGVCSTICACTTSRQDIPASPVNPQGAAPFPSQEFDATSRSSTLVPELSLPAQQRWYLPARWNRAVSKRPEDACASDPPNGRLTLFRLWTRLHVQTPQCNAPDINPDIACLPV